MTSIFGPLAYRGGRVPKSFKYTYKDIARVSGLSYKVIRKYAYIKRFNPYDLGSVVEFLASRRGGGNSKTKVKPK